MEAGGLNAYKAAPDAMRAVQRVEAYIQQCGLEKSLVELVKMRASQINGCAYSSTFTARMPAMAVKPSNGSICSTPGMNHPSIASASGLK
jgi:alkylhydroperoxidase family enzyme